MFKKVKLNGSFFFNKNLSYFVYFGKYILYRWFQDFKKNNFVRLFFCYVYKEIFYFIYFFMWFFFVFLRFIYIVIFKLFYNNFLLYFYFSYFILKYFFNYFYYYFFKNFFFFDFFNIKFYYLYLYKYYYYFFLNFSIYYFFYYYFFLNIVCFSIDSLGSFFEVDISISSIFNLFGYRSFGDNLGVIKNGFNYNLYFLEFFKFESAHSFYGWFSGYHLEDIFHFCASFGISIGYYFFYGKKYFYILEELNNYNILIDKSFLNNFFIFMSPYFDFDYGSGGKYWKFFSLFGDYEGNPAELVHFYDWKIFFPFKFFEMKDSRDIYPFFTRLKDVTDKRDIRGKGHFFTYFNKLAPKMELDRLVGNQFNWDICEEKYMFDGFGYLGLGLKRFQSFFYNYKLSFPIFFFFNGYLFYLLIGNFFKFFKIIYFFGFIVRFFIFGFIYLFGYLFKFFFFFISIFYPFFLYFVNFCGYLIDISYWFFNGFFFNLKLGFYNFFLDFFYINLVLNLILLLKESFLFFFVNLNLIDFFLFFFIGCGFFFSWVYWLVYFFFFNFFKYFIYFFSFGNFLLFFFYYFVSFFFYKFLFFFLNIIGYFFNFFKFLFMFRGYFSIIFYLIFKRSDYLDGLFLLGSLGVWLLDTNSYFMGMGFGEEDSTLTVSRWFIVIGFILTFFFGGILFMFYLTLLQVFILVFFIIYFYRGYQGTFFFFYFFYYIILLIINFIFYLILFFCSIINIFFLCDFFLFYLFIKREFLGLYGF